MYVGNESNLVVDTTNDGFHGSDGFNDAKFLNEPDVGKIKRNEMAHQAILRYTHEYPGLDVFKMVLKSINYLRKRFSFKIDLFLFRVL